MNPATRAPTGTRVHAQPLLAAALAAIAAALAVAGHAGKADAAIVRVYDWSYFTQGASSSILIDNPINDFTDNGNALTCPHSLVQGL